MKSILVIFMMTSLALTFSCKSKPKDADIQKSAVSTLAANPAFTGLTVTVNEGVATITGEAKDEATRMQAQAAVAALKGVKSVQNNTTVYVAPQPVVPTVTQTQADALTKAVNDAIKDYPGVTATVSNQVVTLTGEIQRSNLQKLMMSLNALKSMGLKSIDSKSLVKK